MAASGEVLHACVYSAPAAASGDQTTNKQLDEFSFCLIKVSLQACLPIVLVS